MITNYNHKKIEKKWYKYWEKKKYFHPNYKLKEKYCITIPPPNITGNLHIGHAFQCTLMDILIRYYRMNNYSTLWKVGTDHAGIATQLMVEQALKEKNINKENISKKNFIKEVKKWKKKSIKNINNQLKIIGCSVNWDSERFTMDKQFTKSVKNAFIKLYNENLIYKSEKLVNWDPFLQTAISDLEIIYKKETNKLFFIKYKILDSKDEYITIATTRPETIFGDVAIAVNPKDNRYKQLINKKIIVPISNAIIPIIFDESIDEKFGSGCLKITPGHDFKDFEIGKKHKLEIKNIYTKKITIKNEAFIPEKYRNLNNIDARKKILEELSELKLIEKITEQQASIPRGDRSNSIIEPLITEQWYIKTKTLAKPVINIIKNKKIKIIPIKWEKIFLDWLYNIKDWCISRQIWWGHKIPAWYDENKNIYVEKNEKKLRKKLNIEAPLNQEKSVLDTWFSSALWPFASIGWPKRTIEFKKFYPTSTLVTGFDIIFFWAIRMIMFGLKFTKKIPFQEIYIHGLIRDKKGTKMSKTKGNVIDPIDIITGISYEKLIKKRTLNLINPKLKQKVIESTTKNFPKGISSYGADALRLTLCSIATNDISINLDFKKLEKNKKFCNKLWNASRFIIINIKKENEKIESNYNIYNNWILSKWQKTKKEVINCLENRNFSLLSKKICEFVWNEYCDWFIEFSKILIKEKKYETIKTAKIILIEIIKILHPIIPYITEELWNAINKRIKKKHKSIMIEKYPSYLKEKEDNKSENFVNMLKKIIINIRKIKNKNNEHFIIQVNSKKTLTLIEENILIIKKLSNINDLKIEKKIKTTRNEYLTNNIEKIKILIKIKSIEKTEKELEILINKIKLIENDLIYLEKYSNNNNFLNKALIKTIDEKNKKIKSLKKSIYNAKNYLNSILI